MHRLIQPYPVLMFWILVCLPIRGETQFTTQGPYTLTNDCGQTVQVVLRGYKDLAGFPGLYRWEYEVSNTSFSSGKCGSSAPEDQAGILFFTVAFSEELPDVGNLVFTGPAAAAASWDGNYGITVNAYDVNDGRGIEPGQSVRLSFTTLPRQAANTGTAMATNAVPCKVDGGLQRHAENRGPQERRTEQCHDVGAAVAEPGVGTLDIQVKTLSFTGINLQIDSLTPAIQAPQWVLGTKEKAPSEAAYDAQTSAPAAFVRNTPISLSATFRSGEPSIASCTITATVRDSSDNPDFPWQDLGTQTVTFTAGLSDTVTFTAPVQSATAGAYDVTMRWRAISCLTSSSEPVDGTILNKTKHRLYSLFTTPVAPMATPWAKVLELSSPILAQLTAGGATPTNESIVQEMASAIFNSAWTGYYAVRFFSPSVTYLYVTNASCTCFSKTDFYHQYYNLQNVLDRMAPAEAGGPPVNLQCADNANFHAVLAASQGIAAPPNLIVDNRSGTSDLDRQYLAPTAPHYRAGASDNTCRVSCFVFHQVPTLALLYDTSVRACLGTGLTECNSAADGSPGENLFGYTYSNYLSTAFPTQSSENTEHGPVTVYVSNQCICAK